MPRTAALAPSQRPVYPMEMTPWQDVGGASMLENPGSEAGRTLRGGRLGKGWSLAHWCCSDYFRATGW